MDRRDRNPSRSIPERRRRACGGLAALLATGVGARFGLAASPAGSPGEAVRAEAGAGAVRPPPPSAFERPPRLLGVQVLARQVTVDGLLVGGLSGLDALPSGEWVAISDDRGQHGPPRLFWLELDLRAFRTSPRPGMSGIRFTGVRFLRDRSGSPFAPGLVDPEGVRFDPVTGQLLWIDEGERSARRMAAPALRSATVDGDWARDWRLPAAFAPAGSASGQTPGDRGIRNNRSLEALALDATGRRAFVATEAALVQDGPPPGIDQPSPVRVQAIDLATGQPGRAWVYLVEPAPALPLLPALPAINGLTEMLWLGSDRFLMLERGYTPLGGHSARLWLASAAHATNVAGRQALDGARWIPMEKRLWLDLGALRHADGSPFLPDNFEAMAWGPPDPATGAPTLVLLSDDNFAAHQQTQFVALALG